MTGGTYAGLPEPYETTYPQDVRNCTKCHRAPAPLADHWKTQPSSRALRRLSRRPQLRGDAAARPHRAHRRARRRPTSAAAPATRRAASAGTSRASTPRCPIPTPRNIYASATGNGNTNAAYVAAAGAVPAGAKVVSYVVDSVSTWTDAAAGNVLRPQIVFKFKLDGDRRRVPQSGDGERADPELRRLAERVLRVRGAAGREGGARRLQRLGQRLRQNIWNGTGTCSNAAATTTRTGAGTLTGPDAMGFYTLRLTCATIPANATMLTGGIGYTYALGSRQSPANPDLDFINNTHAAHADRSARPIRTSRTRRRTASRPATAAWAA